MKRAMRFTLRTSCALCAMLAMLIIPATGGTVAAQSPAQKTFATPQDAINALMGAVKTMDRPTIAGILGPKAEMLVSGDAVRDAMGIEAYSKLAAEKVTVETDGSSKAHFVLGEIEWPFPIPVVSSGSAWRFDTDTGIEEIIARRIGSNELSAIAVCRAGALAQWDYFTRDDWDADGVSEYAQLLRSTPGQRDGLYWKTVGQDTPSPLANLVATGESLGYVVKQDAGTESGAFLGYRFKILKAQGPHAAGGRYGYVINRNMIAGFAIVAYPVTHGNSGVMTFIVNQSGRVYQKDLGPNTSAIAGAMTTYDPDPSWALVVDE